MFAPARAFRLATPRVGRGLGRSTSSIRRPSPRAPGSRLGSTLPASPYRHVSHLAAPAPLLRLRPRSWPLIFATLTGCHPNVPATIGRMTYSVDYASPTQYDVHRVEKVPAGAPRLAWPLLKSCAIALQPLG